MTPSVPHFFLHFYVLHLHVFHLNLTWKCWLTFYARYNRDFFLFCDLFFWYMLAGVYQRYVSLDTWLLRQVKSHNSQLIAEHVILFWNNFLVSWLEWGWQWLWSLSFSYQRVICCFIVLNVSDHEYVLFYMSIVQCIVLIEWGKLLYPLYLWEWMESSQHLSILGCVSKHFENLNLFIIYYNNSKTNLAFSLTKLFQR